MSREELIKTCDEQTLGKYLTYLHEESVCSEVNGLWIVNQKIDNFGPTFERYIALVMEREFACPAEWGIGLDNFPSGDFDVLAVCQSILSYIECKTTKPTSITEDELSQYIKRVRDLGSKLSILLIDTEDDIISLAERLRDVIEKLQGVPSGINMRSGTKRQPVCLFYHGQYIFVANNHPSVKTELGICLNYYGRNVSRDPFPK
ncbi:MAG: hypothetical protein KKF26_04915 [Chloroflexi bacterium]|nr:hypothetical protein [Chloroflexota bacterium]